MPSSLAWVDFLVTLVPVHIRKHNEASMTMSHQQRCEVILLDYRSSFFLSQTNEVVACVNDDNGLYSPGIY